MSQKTDDLDEQPVQLNEDMSVNPIQILVWTI